MYTGTPEYVSISEGGSKPGLIPSSGILPATVPASARCGGDGARSLRHKVAWQKSCSLRLSWPTEFPIDELRVSYIERTRKIFEPWPTSAKVFLPGGRVPKPGEMFSQPDLARTLREIVTAERTAASRGRHAALTLPEITSTRA